mmetsp:Transcript_50900/g.111490  ORF Transcript_50900/g.111490 Transcript_50900/m.111490 type:complete len:942 (-) Transcript_50900:263-3088(-)
MQPFDEIRASPIVEDPDPVHDGTSLSSGASRRRQQNGVSPVHLGLGALVLVVVIWIFVAGSGGGNGEVAGDGTTTGSTTAGPTPSPGPSSTDGPGPSPGPGPRPAPAETTCVSFTNLCGAGMRKRADAAPGTTSDDCCATVAVGQLKLSLDATAADALRSAYSNATMRTGVKAALGQALGQSLNGVGATDVSVLGLRAVEAQLMQARRMATTIQFAVDYEIAVPRGKSVSDIAGMLRNMDSAAAAKSIQQVFASSSIAVDTVLGVASDVAPTQSAAYEVNMLVPTTVSETFTETMQFFPKLKANDKLAFVPSPCDGQPAGCDAQPDCSQVVDWIELQADSDSLAYITIRQAQSAMGLCLNRDGRTTLQRLVALDVLPVPPTDLILALSKDSPSTIYTHFVTTVTFEFSEQHRSHPVRAQADAEAALVPERAFWDGARGCNNGVYSPVLQTVASDGQILRSAKLIVFDTGTYMLCWRYRGKIESHQRASHEAVVQQDAKITAMSGDGRWLFLATKMGSVRRWDLELVETHKGNYNCGPDATSDLCPRGDAEVMYQNPTEQDLQFNSLFLDRYIFAGTTRGDVIQWELSGQGRGPSSLLVGHTAKVTGMAARGDQGARELITGSADGSLRIWSMEDTKPKEIIYNAHSGSNGVMDLACLSWGDDCDWIVTVGDTELKIWPVNSDVARCTANGMREVTDGKAFCGRGHSDAFCTSASLPYCDEDSGTCTATTNRRSEFDFGRIPDECSPGQTRQPTMTIDVARDYAGSNSLSDEATLKIVGVSSYSNFVTVAVDCTGSSSPVVGLEYSTDREGGQFRLVRRFLIDKGVPSALSIATWHDKAYIGDSRWAVYEYPLELKENQDTAQVRDITGIRFKLQSSAKPESMDLIDENVGGSLVTHMYVAGGTTVLKFQPAPHRPMLSYAMNSDEADNINAVRIVSSGRER